MASEATKVIEYLQKLKITQGPRAGDPFIVLPWEKRFVRGFLGAQVSALSVARGNGKTTLLAGIAAAALSGPLARDRGEILLVAGAFSQAKISFDHVLSFLDPEAGKRYRIQDSANNAEILDNQTGCRLKCAGASPRLLMGRAPVLILGDEPSSWMHTQSDKMVSALLTGLGKHEGARAVFLGTRPGSAENFFQRMLDGNADFSAQYATPKDVWEKKPFTLEAIRRANPSLAHMPDLQKAIKKDAERAGKDASMLPAYLALRLNAGVSDVVESVLLEAGTWERIEGNADVRGACIWGIDLSTCAAQSAIACFWPQSGRLEAISAFPATPSLRTRGTNDGAGTLYENCFRRGELIIAGNHTVDVPELLRVALARFGKPAQLVADRWRIADLREACAKAKIPLTRIIERGMGFKDGAEDVRNFRKACLDGDVVPVQSLLLRSAMSVSRTISDPSGNAKLAKAGEGKRPGARDDATAAAILAVSSGTREPPRSGSRRVYYGMA